MNKILYVYFKLVGQLIATEIQTLLTEKLRNTGKKGKYHKC